MMSGEIQIAYLWEEPPDHSIDAIMLDVCGTIEESRYEGVTELQVTGMYILDGNGRDVEVPADLQEALCNLLCEKYRGTS